MATLKVHARAGASTKTHIQAGKHEFLIDEPVLFGGEDGAPSRWRCCWPPWPGRSMPSVSIRQRRCPCPCGAWTIQIEGECNADCFFGKSFEERAGFQTIRAAVTADTDAPEELQARWREQVLLRCPVLDNLRVPAKVEVDFGRRRRCIMRQGTILVVRNLLVKEKTL